MNSPVNSGVERTTLHRFAYRLGKGPSPVHSTLILLTLALGQSLAHAQPVVSGNTISVPAGDWYQIQSSSTYESLCQGVTSCAVPDGDYIVINHTTGERFTNIVVSAAPPAADSITVNGNTIRWPDDGWYQVQSEADNLSICEGGRSCEVADGRYRVINLTTGQRFTGIEVGGDPDVQPPTSGITLNGNTISWQGNDWYQVQDASDYRSVCEGGTSCTVEPGTYHIINLTSGVRIDNFQVGDSSNPETPVSGNDLIAAAQAPIIDDNNQVSWAFSPTDSDVTLTIEPFVEMPLASDGNPARWNAMTTLDEQIFILDEQDGRIYDITGGQASLWFDMADAIQSTTGRRLNIDNPFHGGLRSIAFHPDFASNGKLYASLLEERPADPALHHYLSDAATLDADSVLVEWTVGVETMNVDPTSYREVFRVGIPEYDHPIKQIAFDPSASADDSDYGLLYIAHGDGSKESTTTVGGQGNNALGKILRINPLANGSAGYSIPAGNPFAGNPGMLDEVWSLGHRNPHHPAFMQDGTLFVGEDGRDNIDEINLIVAGGDYGWSQREGAYLQLGQPGLASGVAVLPDNDADNDYRYPVAQFGHTGNVGASFTGQALGGGFVVENGSELDGLYFYIDFPKSGEIFHSRVTDLLAANTQGTPASLSVARTWRDRIVFDHDNNPDTAGISSSMKAVVQSANGFVDTNDRVDLRYGQGPAGELYLFSKRNNMVYLVSNSVPESSASSAPHGAAVRDLMSAEASAAAPADCLLTASPASAPFYCFSPADRRLMRIEQDGRIAWQFPLPGENASNHMESISFINGHQVAIIADATPSPDDSAFDMSLFEQTGAYIGTYHIIADIENPDGVDFAGVNLDGHDLFVRTGPLRQDEDAAQGYTSDLYVYGEHYSARPDANLTLLSGWKKEGAFRARLDSRTGMTLDTRLFPGISAAQAVVQCAVPTSAAVDGC